MQNIIKKAGVLIEAIPYIHDFRRKVFVIKYGGSILEDAQVRENIFQDIVFLSFVGIRTVLVHGGGPHVSNRLKTIGVEPKFHHGIRVTDQQTLNIVVEEFTKLNEQLVQEIKEFKGDVTGLRDDEHLIIAEKKQSDIDLGFVGQIKEIRREVIANHLKEGYITVVSPVGYDEQDQAYNINADEVACAIASTMKAEKLVMLTNVPGVMQNPQDPESLYSTLTVQQTQDLIANQTIVGGMIPKVHSCIHTIESGVHKAHIIDARMKHALLLEIFTDTGIGTQIIS